MDGYQECYHCPIAHLGLSKSFKMSTYKVVPKTKYCRHFAEVIEPEEEVTNRVGNNNGLWMYLFPTNCYSPACIFIESCQ